MIVVDANVWLRALVDVTSRGDWCRKALATDPDWVVPGHCPLEVLRALGKYELAGLLSRSAIDRFAQAVLMASYRVVEPERTLLEYVWRMRHNVSVYDAPYLAIASRDGIPLATCDQRLALMGQQLGIDLLTPDQ